MKIIKTIFSGRECSEVGGGQLVQRFPKYNCKPDILCRLVPFIWAGVVGVGGEHSLQREQRAHWFFLFQIKKGTSKSTKIAILRKKRNFREPVAKFDK